MRAAADAVATAGPCPSHRVAHRNIHCVRVERKSPARPDRQDIVAFVTDAFGNAISGVTVTFTVQPSAGGAGGSFSGNQTTVMVETSTKGNAIAPTLKDQASNVSAASGSAKLRGALVASQVALSLVLLVGAGLFAKSLYNLQAVDPGFRTSNLISFSIDPALNRDSARKLLSLRPSVACFGHGPPLRDLDQLERFVGRLRGAGSPVVGSAAIMQA